MATVPCQTFPALPTGALGQIKIRNNGATATSAQPVEIYHRFSAGEMPKGATLAAVQCDARTAYPNGSICDAQITAIAPPVKAGDTQYAGFSAGAAPTGSVDISTLNHTIEVDIAADPSATGARPVTAMSIDIASQIKASTDFWRQGPIVTEASTQVLDTGIDSLRLIADVSLYSDGTWRGVLTLANDLTAMIAGNATGDARSAAFVATIKVDGTVVQTETLNLAPGIWGYVWIGQQPTIEAIPDPAVQTARGVVLPFDLSPLDATLVSNVEAVAPYTIGSTSIVTTQMEGTGARADIAPHHNYIIAGYLAGTPKSRGGARAVGLTNASIPWHIANPTDGSWWTYQDAPTPGPIWPPAYTAGYSKTATGAGCSNATWHLDQAHFPELAAMGYVQNGERHWLRELQATTHWAVLFQWAATRGKTGDIIVNGEQVRGAAWTFRNLAYAASLTPSNDPNKAIFQQAVDDNLAALKTQFDGQTTKWGPIWIGAYGDIGAFGPWQQDYASTGLAYLAFNGHAAAGALMDRWANWQIGRFSAGASGYVWADGFTYIVGYFPPSDGAGQNPKNLTVLYPEWAQLEAATIAMGQSNLTASGTLDTTFPHAHGDYPTLAIYTLGLYGTLGSSDATAAAQFIAKSGIFWAQPAYFSTLPCWRIGNVQAPAQGVYGPRVTLTYTAPSAPGVGFDFSKVQAAQTAMASGSTTTSAGSSSGTTTASGGSGSATATGGSATATAAAPAWVAGIQTALTNAATIGATKVTFTFDAATAKVIGTDWSA